MRNSMYFILLFLIVTGLSCAREDNEKNSEKEVKGVEKTVIQEVWNIDNLTSLGGHTTTVLGSPKVIDTPKGKAVEFDGEQDALIVDIHPLEGATEFTLEVIFRPDPDGLEEQRFFHLQEDGTNNRFLLETRLLENNMWALDSFLSSNDVNQTLIDRTLTHPLGEWYNVTLVLDGRVMSHYINGVRELSAELPSFTPHKMGKTSVGVRINKIYWFKGAMRKARFTRRALSPVEFLKP